MSNELRPLKTYKTFHEQLDLLRARGLSVGDEQAALAALQRLGYYRLSGYFYPLRKTKPAGDPRALERLFGALSCLRFLMQQIAPDSTWHRNLRAHVATFPVTPLVSVKSAGFPEGWSKLPLWM